MRTTNAISALNMTDLKTNVLFDILVATAQGVRVYIAEDHLDYVTGQWLDTGDTTAMVLHDFNGNGLSDLIVEVAPGIEQVIDVGDIFGPQPIITTGKRVIRYAFFDHLGSTRMLTDDYGDVVWPSMGGEPNKLAPFGKDLAYSESDIVRESYLLNFTNKEIDYNLDLHYFGARYYTADFPRFISPDPVSGKPMNPITWNRYLYCRNDPINYFDPDGEDFYFLIDMNAMAWLGNAGHTAVITGPVDGKWRYDSFGKGGEGHRHGVYKDFNSLDEALKFAEGRGYTDYLVWNTTPDQDRAAQELADLWHSGSGGSYMRILRYNLLFRSCQSLFDAMAKAAGVKTRALPIPHPRWTFGRNRNEAHDRGTLAEVQEESRRRWLHLEVFEEMMAGRRAEHGQNSFN
jgi:RHS repeat-associated protein